MQTSQNLINRFIKFDLQNLFHGASWLMSGHIVSMLAVLFTSYFFANYISPTLYGEYKYLISAGAILSIFSLTGAGAAVTQAAAKNVRGFFNYASMRNLQYGIFVAILGLTGAIYYFLNGNMQLASGLLLIALCQPLFNNSNLIFSHLQGLQRFKVLTKAHTLKTIFTSTSTVLAILLSGKVFTILATYLVSNLAINYLITYIHRPDKATPDKEGDFVSIKKYAEHTSIRNFFLSASGQLDKLLIFQFLGAVELAVYAFATALPDQYKGLTKTVDMLILPRFSQSSYSRITSGLMYKVFVYFLVLLFACLLYIAVAPFIFKTLYPAYEHSVLLSQIYSIGIIFGFVGIPLAGLQSQLSEKYLYYFHLGMALFQSLSILLGLLLYGLLGIIVARVLTRAFIAFFALFLFRRASTNH